MVQRIVFILELLGSAVMIFNIYGFISFSRYIRRMHSWGKRMGFLYLPIALLLLFLLGYLAVWFFGEPDLVVAGILFGGSIFVLIMYLLLGNIIQQIQVGEQAEARLMASEESSRVKSRFLAGVSHEMRTPLNVILGQTGFVLRDSSLSDETRRRVERVDMSARHLLGLINNILDINVLEAGGQVARSEEFQLGKSLDQVAAIGQSLCEDKGLTFEFSVPDFDKVRCVGDENRLKQVLLCLLDNAVKFTPAPGTVTLSAECTQEGEGPRQCRFTVSDTGVGISEEFLPKIFDTFSREDESSTSLYGGSGLSLAVARRAVELMGGTITVDSKKGEGSAFHVTLPLRLAEDKDAAGAAAPDGAALASLEGCRILVAEDIPENAEIVMDILELEGVVCEHAENGQVAVDMFSASEEGYYDAVLMDLRMPVMDGLDATRAIRTLPRGDAWKTPIIALTANTFESDVRHSLEAGMDEHLPKPVDAELLYSSLKKYIGQRRLAEKNDEERLDKQ